MSDLGDWFRSIPLITRYWFASSIAVPLLGKLGLINPMYLILWPEYFLHKFQVMSPQPLYVCTSAWELQLPACLARHRLLPLPYNIIYGGVLPSLCISELTQYMFLKTINPFLSDLVSLVRTEPEFFLGDRGTDADIIVKRVSFL